MKNVRFWPIADNLTPSYPRYPKSPVTVKQRTIRISFMPGRIQTGIIRHYQYKGRNLRQGNFMVQITDRLELE